jgi:hypothetical protein
MLNEAVDFCGGRLIASEELDRLSGYGLASNVEYLARCQVSTPESIVPVVWKIASKYRDSFLDVLDAGAGDGRFALNGKFDRYFGYEIDSSKQLLEGFPVNGKVINACAFSDADLRQYDLSIGNPPYARHHDIGKAWREQVRGWIRKNTGENPSGLSNAYLYFLWLSLICTTADGLVVLVIPFEWVSKPTAASLREFIARNGWALDVYKFAKDPFPRVLTTASVTVIDKKRSDGAIRYFTIDDSGVATSILTPTRSNLPALNYRKRGSEAFAQRGLSPGGQKIFVLTEEERTRHGLIVGVDVLPCVTSMKNISDAVQSLTPHIFDRFYVRSGKRCWLISTSDEMSSQLEKYLAGIPLSERSNSTCSNRKVWWKYNVPKVPQALYASGFRGKTTKVVVNKVGAINVGAVCGIYAKSGATVKKLVSAIRNVSLDSEVVAVSKGFTKIEINQMNAFIQRVLA